MRKSLSIHGRSLQHLTRNFLLPILLFLWSGSVWGQVSVTALPYSKTDNFNSYNPTTLSNTTSTIPAGWAFASSGTAAYRGITASPSTTGGYYGFSSATDSSLGALRTSGTGNITYTVSFTNNSGSTITALNIGWNYEQWSFSNASGFDVTGTGQLATNTTLNAADFVGTASGTAGASTPQSLNLTGLNITNGQSFGITWITTDPAGSDNAVSIDDFSITATSGPSITTSVATLTGFSATPSTASAQQTFNVSGSALTNDISIAPSTNYEISTVSGVGFTATNPITLTRTSGTVATTPIYVRLKSGLPLGAYNGEIINITSTGATAKTVTVSGDVIRNTITSTTSGDWNTGTTWVGGVVPTSADNVVIVAGHTVSVATAVTRDSGVTTTVNGSFQLNNGGYAGGTAFTYAATGSGLIFNNGGLYGIGSGNAFWPTTNPPFNVTVNPNNNGSGAQTNVAVGAVNGILALNGELRATTAVTVNGTLQLNSGGYVSTNAPVYGSASTLLYNTTYGVGTEWTGSGTTVGAGVPFNVSIQNTAVVTTPAGVARGMGGNLNIISGTLSLGHDLNLAGNWTNSGTFNPNTKAVFFTAATGTQTITNTAGETFDYLIHNGAGLLKFNNNVTVRASTGDVLQLVAGTIDLNAKALTLSGSGGNVKVATGQILNSTVAGATFNITGTSGTKYIYNGTLSIPANVTTILNNGLDFGSNLTTIAGTLRVATGGFVTANPPIYTGTSTLEYNGVTSYGVNNEWTGNAATAGAGVPQNVTLTNSSVNMPNTARGMAGNLNIASGSNLILNATLGADLALAGTFTNSGTFTPNNRAVTFNGGAAQTISGATSFDYFIVDKTAGNVTLAASIIVNKDLTLTNRYLVLGAFNLTLPNKSSVITSNATSYINAISTGKLIRQNIDGTADWIFPMGANTAGRYIPITLKNLSGTTEIQVSTNATYSKSLTTSANALISEWRITSNNNVTANLRADWTASEQNAGVVNPGSGDLGVYNSTVGTNYTLYDVTLAQYNTQATAVSLASTGVNSVVIGNDDSIAIANDECVGAKTVVVDAAAISGSTTNSSSSLSAITCNAKTSTTARDVWYKFTTSAAGYYKIEVVKGTISDQVLDLRSGACNGTNMACSDITTNGTESITIDLPANTIYSYRIYNNGSALGDGSFTTSVTTVPTIIVNPSTLDFGDVPNTTDSAIKTSTIKASMLTTASDNISLNAPTGYQLSLDGITAWSSTLSLPFTGSTLAETTVYVKLNPSDCGTYNGNITATGGGAATANIAVTGKGIIPVAVAAAATDITATTFTAHWGAITGATGYKLDVYQRSTSSAATEAFNNLYSTTLPGWTSTSVSAGPPQINMTSSSSSVTSIAVDLTDYTTKKLNFKARTFGGSATPAKNKITVSISTNNGGTWQLLGDRTPATNSLTDMAEFDLAAYTGTQVKIRFQTSGADGTVGAGISNLVLSGNKTTTTVTFANNYNPKIISGGSTTSEIVTGLTPNTQYYYILRVTTATCESVSSNEIAVTTNNTIVWNAGAWSNTTGPDANLDGIVRSTYSVGDAGQPTFTVKNLTVESTGLLEIRANNGIIVAGTITTADDKIVIDSDGSLLQTNAPANNTNSGKIIAKRDVKMSLTDYTYWSTPVTGQILKNTATGSGPNTYTTGGFSEGTPNNRIYDYYEPTDNFKATADADFANAKGYAIRGKNTYSTTVHTLDTSLKFTGVANNGVYSIGVQKSKNTTIGTSPTVYTHGYNLIGNPYPSNINFITFYNLERDGVKNSDVINAKAWFWTNSSPTKTQSGSAYTGNNYATITLAGGASPTTVNGATGTPTPNEFIKVGQGFIVEMLGTPPTGTTPITATLKFDNTVRTNNSTGYFYNNNKSSEAINRYWVKLISPENIVNTILVAHMDGATNNYDANYDAELLTVGDDSFYSKLNTQKLQIQARNNPLSNDDVIPLGTKYAANGTYKISLGSKEGIFESDHKIYLKDKLSNTYTDLTIQDYAFSAVIGSDDSRFEIVYKDNAVLGTDSNTKSDFTVYRDGESYVIKSSKSLGKIEIYDTSGRMLITSSAKENTAKIDASSLTNGVYIIKVENSGDLKTKKVIK